VWLFLVFALGRAGSAPSAQTPDPNAASAQPSGAGPVKEIISPLKKLNKHGQALNQKHPNTIVGKRIPVLRTRA